MAYNELIKNFDGIRDYMREFYVYGFKSRGEYSLKSARSYDDERRRVESWLGDFMCFRRGASGKAVFLSIDSRLTRRNPLYKAWGAKSFTDGDITLHFYIFDILASPDISLSLNDIIAEIDARLACFAEPKSFDASTVRKKLNEYVREGLIVAERRGRSVCYSRSADEKPACPDALAFFSEVAPCGAIGSPLVKGESCFSFKHHYITQSLDSEILLSVFESIRAKRSIVIVSAVRGKSAEVVPLKIYCSVQNGRQYLMGWELAGRRLRSFRLDNILSVKSGEVCARFDEYRGMLERISGRLWGVSIKAAERLEFCVSYGEGEEYIPRRLEREKRCGRVVKEGERSARFSADLLDAGEAVPWIRSFIGRITELSCSDKAVEERFKSDLDEMYRIYGLDGGDDK